MIEEDSGQKMPRITSVGSFFDLENRIKRIKRDIVLTATAFHL